MRNKKRKRPSKRFEDSELQALLDKDDPKTSYGCHEKPSQYV